MNLLHAIYVESLLIEHLYFDHVVTHAAIRAEHVQMLTHTNMHT